MPKHEVSSKDPGRGIRRFSFLSKGQMEGHGLAGSREGGQGSGCRGGD